MVVNKNIEGSHILADGPLEKDILDIMGLQTGAPLPLPRYLLLGPDDRILSSDLDRPSSPEFLDRLKAYIKKYKTG